MIWDEIIRKEPITKGWSCDKKYRATTNKEERYLLRMTPHTESESRKAFFESLQKISIWAESRFENQAIQ